jgi:hypothetical protein
MIVLHELKDYEDVEIWYALEVDYYEDSYWCALTNKTFESEGSAKLYLKQYEKHDRPMRVVRKTLITEVMK